MPNGYAYTPSGLAYIPDISLPQQLQPSLPQLQLPAYMPTLAMTMPTTPSGLGYIPDILLPQELQPTTPSGLGYIPDVSLPEQLQPPAVEQPVGYGPLELIGDVAKTAGDIIYGAAKGIVDAGKSIIENIEVGVGIAKGVGEISAQEKMIKVAKMEAEAKKIAAEAYKIQTLAAQTTGMPAIIPTKPKAQPLTYITPKTGEAPNYMLYIALAILALIFLRKR